MIPSMLYLPNSVLGGIGEIIGVHEATTCQTRGDRFAYKYLLLTQSNYTYLFISLIRDYRFVLIFGKSLTQGYSHKLAHHESKATRK